MASWMIHFRVAEALMDKGTCPVPRTPEADTAFVMGNIAPDSGVPAEDGRHYIPDKHVSHFHVRNTRAFHECDLAAFTGRYLAPPPADPVARAFYLGYLAHLYTDNQWVEKIGIPAEARFPHEYRDGYADARGRVKSDWYHLDCQYLKEHLDLPAFRLYAEAPPFRNTYVDFFAEDAFDARRSFILDFYHRGIVECRERETYLSMVELDAFVRETAEELRSLSATLTPL